MCLRIFEHSEGPPCPDCMVKTKLLCEQAIEQINMQADERREPTHKNGQTSSRSLYSSYANFVFHILS